MLRLCWGSADCQAVLGLCRGLAGCEVVRDTGQCWGRAGCGIMLRQCWACAGVARDVKRGLGCVRRAAEAVRC